MSSKTYKTSTIFIGTDKGTKVFRSVSDVPPRLRRRLLEITNGENSGVILIADRGGRDEIMRALRRRNKPARALAQSRPASNELRALARLKQSIPIWPELVVLALIAIVVWVVLLLR